MGSMRRAAVPAAVSSQGHEGAPNGMDVPQMSRPPLGNALPLGERPNPLVCTCLRFPLGRLGFWWRQVIPHLLCCLQAAIPPAFLDAERKSLDVPWATEKGS